jgi:hypothetical protein
MSEIPEVLERLRRGPELLATALTGAAGPELDFTPAEGKWSVRQIVAHLADSEMVAAYRFRGIIAEDNPVLMAYDQEAWARNLNYGRRKTSEATETFRRIRSESHDLLKELPPEAYQRRGNHSERGPVTLLEMVEMMAAHLEKHARQIQGVRAAYRQKRRTAGA